MPKEAEELFSSGLQARFEDWFFGLSNNAVDYFFISAIIISFFLLLLPLLFSKKLKKRLPKRALIIVIVWFLSILVILGIVWAYLLLLSASGFYQFN